MLCVRSTAVPRLQMYMTAKMVAAMSTVNQPPWKNFVRLEKKNMNSMAPNITAKTTAAGVVRRIFER